jgi:heptaprenyl diphosphate synthase
VAADLAPVGQEIARATGAADPALAALVGHLAALGGKRLRPALMLLARGGQPADAAALKAAAAIELIHLASLYHDDIMDRSATRRGADSVNARWGNCVAALGGTFLFARSQRLLMEVGEQAVALGASASAQLCAGQLREAENAYNLDLAISEHLEILGLKTATLFVLAVELGCLLAGAPPERRAALTAYGEALGIAFQLYDDVLDWVGQRAVMGKAAGTDIRSGVYNLPLLQTLANGGEPADRLRRLLMKNALTDDDLDEAAAIVAMHGVAEARRQATAAANRAVASLAPLPADPVGRSLEALAMFAVSREV